MFINTSAFLYVNANSKEIFKEMPFPSLVFQKNAVVSILDEFEG